MNIAELIQGLNYKADESIILNGDVTNIVFDSRKVVDGSMFVAIKRSKCRWT